MAWHALPAEAACTRLRVDPLRGLDEAEAAALYRHALATAALAQALAPDVGVDEQDAFMAGLFHDLGRVFVLTASGQVRTKEKKAPPPTASPSCVAR